MQTLSIPYACAPDDAVFLERLRRVQSAAIRTAYANADGMSETDLRDLVKARHAGAEADAWLLHCATREGLTKRKIRPDGRMVFGGRRNLGRRRDGLIGPEEWKAFRLLPLVSLGDRTFSGNRHFRLAPDGLTCVVRVYGRAVTLRLAEMHGKWGVLTRQVAALAAAGEINLTFRLGRKLEVTFDPMDLRKLPPGKTLREAKSADGGPKRGRKSKGDGANLGGTWPANVPRPVHPEWRDPVTARPGRALGVDLNPNWIGLSVIENLGDATRLSETRIVDHALIQIGLPKDASDETMREVLAAACSRAIGLARKHGAGLIALEKGLGKLRSSGRNRSLNRLINGWARTVFAAMLARKARLAGLVVIEVWGAYSTTLGNLAFEAPDACASAGEIARRGLALSSGMKELLPAFEPWVTGLRWKDVPLPESVHPDSTSARGWGELHRSIKAAKLGVRRPHPALPDTGVPRHGVSLLPDGHAVRRLHLRNRPGALYVPVDPGGGRRRNRGEVDGAPRAATLNYG